MQRFLERILGLDEGFLSRDGEFAVRFNPPWPSEPWLDAGSFNWPIGVALLALLLASFRFRPAGTRLEGRFGMKVLWLAMQALLVAALFSLLGGALAWNVAIGALAFVVLGYVYSRDGRSVAARASLGVLRALLVAFVIALLNRPVLTLGETHVEPSVVAVLIDQSMSMGFRDAEENADPETGTTRLEAAVKVLTDEDAALLRQLAAVHDLRFYYFSGDARALSAGVMAGGGSAEEPVDPKTITPDPKLVEELKGLKPEGDKTQVVPSLKTVLSELQGQRLAGLVLITDGRETPNQTAMEAAGRLARDFEVPIFPVAVGSDQLQPDVEIQSVKVNDSVFADDIVDFKLTMRLAGSAVGRPVRVVLKDKDTGLPLTDADGKPAERVVTAADDTPLTEELQFKPQRLGTLNVVAEAEELPGEADKLDNQRTARVDVLDAKINVLYVDGYPRWEYRYLKNEMIRDKTVNISCLLRSADQGFAQEGDKADPDSNFPGPIKRFPESIEEMVQYDVVLFGDVDPRDFPERQLELVRDFVYKRGGGFGMVAGPQWSPWAYVRSPLEAVLPVELPEQFKPEYDPSEVITEGFRPVLTRAGAASSVFRFYPDRELNEKFIREQLQPLFWYSTGVVAKPGVGEVYAEHPTELDPEGKTKAPILVLGRYGAGRTMFSAIDDTWRWRFYTGESIFDTYWVQQLRYLARSKKLGQRDFEFRIDRKEAKPGDPVRATLEVRNPAFLEHLPRNEVTAELKDQNGNTVKLIRLQRQAGLDEYSASFTAETLGAYTVRLAPVGGKPEDREEELVITVPQLEKDQPQIYLPLLRALAATDPQTQQRAVLTLATARQDLPRLLPSAAVRQFVPTDEPLWDAPLAMAIFVLLLTLEWVLRKAYGML